MPHLANLGNEIFAILMTSLLHLVILDSSHIYVSKYRGVHRLLPPRFLPQRQARSVSERASKLAYNLGLTINFRVTKSSQLLLQHYPEIPTARPESKALNCDRSGRLVSKLNMSKVRFCSHLSDHAAPLIVFNKDPLRTSPVNAPCGFLCQLDCGQYGENIAVRVMGRRVQTAHNGPHNDDVHFLSYMFGAQWMSDRQIAVRLKEVR